MARPVKVDYVGDSRDLGRASKEAERDIQRVAKTSTRASKDFDAVGKSADRQKKKLLSFGNATAIAFGAAGVAAGINHSIKAFQAQEKASANLVASLKTLGINTTAVRKRIDEVTLAQQRMSGFADEDLQTSFATIIRSAGDVDTAFKGNALAMDIARARGIDVTKVAQVLAKVYDGNVGILKRYGVAVEKDATVSEALAAAQKRYAGQAKAWGETTAGASAKASAEFNNLEEELGSKFAPALNATAGGILTLTHGIDGLAQSVGGLGPLLAGAAGIGAFRLAAPAIAKTAEGISTLAARSALAGGGFGGMSAAIKGSISPMGVATVGVGALAAGVYLLWHNAESADQAVQGLNKTIGDTGNARQQAEVAKNNVNAARDYVKATHDAEQAARRNAVALHGEVTARREEVQSLKDHHASASKVETATNKVAAAEKKWQKALDDVVPAVHAHQSAATQLKIAKQNLKTATDGVTDAEDKQARKSDDVRGKVAKQASQAAKLAGNWREVGRAAKDGGDGTVTAAERARRGAAIWAASFDRAARATARTNSAVSTVDRNLAGLARAIGRIPTTREVKIVTRLSQQGLSLAEIKRRLDLIQSKEVTVRFNQTFGQRVNPLTGLTATTTRRVTAKPATGAWVAGRYGDGDRVPAYLSGEEAVLNPDQIDMVGRDRVMGALHATGAPTIGRGFAGGKAPGRARDGEYRMPSGFVGFRRRGGKWSARLGGEWQSLASLDEGSVGSLISSYQGRGMSRAQVAQMVEWWHTHARGGVVYAAKGKVPDRGKRLSSTAKPPKVMTPAERMRREIDQRKTFFDLALAKSDQAFANAQGTAGVEDDIAALQADSTQRKAYRDWLGKLIRNPAKTTGVPGARLTAKDRTDLISEQTAQTRGINDDAVSIWDLQHPEATEAEAAAGEAGATAAEAGPTADQQLVAEKLAERLAQAQTRASLSEAELAAFRGSGDIGTGNFGNALGAGAGPAMLITLGDQRSLSALGGAMVAGVGGQAAIPANRETVGIR